MAYDEFLSERIENQLKTKGIPYEPKKMMGGICFMVDDKMCVGVVKDNLMARIDPEFYDRALQVPGARPMDFTGRQMKGFVFVEPKGTDLDSDLEYWVDRCLEFNPKAKSSKKRKN